MHKIDHVTATVNKEFTSGNAQTGAKPTVVTPEWLNSVQNEIANVIISRGIELEKSNNTQLAQALSSLISVQDKNLEVPNNVIDFILTPFKYLADETLSVVLELTLHRKDSLKEELSIVKILIRKKPVLEILVHSDFDEGCGVVFGVQTVTEGEKEYIQLTCSTTNYSGANYNGSIVYKETVFKA